MKNYTISEAALVLGVTSVTVNNWIKSGDAIPSRTVIGQPYFTEEQVVNLFVKQNIGRGRSGALRVMYIVNEDSKEELEKTALTCHTVQKEVAPKAAFIENIATLLQRTVENCPLDENDEQYRNSMYTEILQEIGVRLNKYVSNKVDMLYRINHKYKDFTRHELEAIILGDTNVVTPNLRLKFDAVLEEAKTIQDSSNMTATGEFKKCRELPASFLGSRIGSVVNELLGKFGLSSFDLTTGDIRTLLLFADFPYEKECVLLFGRLLKSGIKINYSLPDVKKVAEVLKQKYTKVLMQARLECIRKEGCYHIFPILNGDTDAAVRLFNMLELDTFTQVVVFNHSYEKLHDAVKFRLSAGEAANKFRVDRV